MTKTKIEGELLGLDKDGLVGWAWDESRPYDPLKVEILADGALLARVVADRFSLDLVRRRKGNGMHLFKAMPRSLAGRTFPLRITARVAGTRTPLAGEVRLASLADLVGVLPDAAFHRFTGHVDGLIEGAVRGWVVNTLVPGRPVDLELVEAGGVLSRCRASGARQDVAALHPGAEQSGFALPVPAELLDGASHRLHVRVAGSDHELPGSPVLFGPGCATGLAAEVAALREEVAELRAAAADAGSGGPAQTMASELLARFEALFSIQRDAFEREVAVLRAALLDGGEGEPRFRLPRGRKQARRPRPVLVSDSATGSRAAKGPLGRLRRRAG